MCITIAYSMQHWVSYGRGTKYMPLGRFPEPPSTVTSLWGFGGVGISAHYILNSLLNFTSVLPSNLEFRSPPSISSLDFRLIFLLHFSRFPVMLVSDKGQLIQSHDGTKIWAQAAGNPSKPAVVFIHGFSCTALHFSKQFSDSELLENLYLVSI